MIGGNDRLILTALFAAVGAWYLAAAVRALRNAGQVHRGQALGAALHVLVSAAIISMCWSWGTGIPVIAQVTVFTAAAGWFAGVAVFGAPGSGDGNHLNWYHAGMMAVMVWMAVSVPLIAAPSGGGGIPAAGGGPAGLDVGGPGPVAAGGATTAMPAGAPQGWAGTVCLILAAVLFAAAAWQAITALRPLAAPEGERTTATARSGSLGGVSLRDGVSALMAAGMAVALLGLA